MEGGGRYMKVEQPLRMTLALWNERRHASAERGRDFPFKVYAGFPQAPPHHDSEQVSNTAWGKGGAPGEANHFKCHAAHLITRLCLQSDIA